MLREKGILIAHGVTCTARAERSDTRPFDLLIAGGGSDRFSKVFSQKACAVG
jgi:hypothetical protein